MSTVIPGTVSGFRSLVDGTLRLSVDIEPADARAALDLLIDGHAPVALARLNLEPKIEPAPADVMPPPLKPEKGEFVEYARKLHATGFFSSPDVWRAIGSDAQFLDWIRTQPCCLRGSPHSVGVEAAHLRSVAAGSGTGVKPPYCAVPMCSQHHREQHDKGYSAVHKDGLEGLMKIRHRLVAQWAHQALVKTLGYEHLSDIDPEIIEAWASRQDVEQYLPR